MPTGKARTERTNIKSLVSKELANKPVFRIRVRNPLLFDPGSGMGRKISIRVRDDNPDHISESLKNNFWVKILKFFDVDPGSGMEKIRIRVPGWEKVGFGIKIPDPQHCNKQNSFTSEYERLVAFVSVCTVPFTELLKISIEEMNANEQFHNCNLRTGTYSKTVDCTHCAPLSNATVFCGAMSH
jgi:hypothetical protein